MGALVVSREITAARLRAANPQGVLSLVGALGRDTGQSVRRNFLQR